LRGAVSLSETEITDKKGKRVMLQRMLALGAAGLALAGVAASGAAGDSNAVFRTTANFLCYSKFQVDPGAYATAKTSFRIHYTAADLLALGGYWSPYAEKSVPTRTLIAGGYYLICNLPAGLNQVQSVIVTQKGVLLPWSPKYVGESGLYSEAA
jgi:hypothetical protein